MGVKRNFVPENYTYESPNKDLLKLFDIEHGQENNLFC